MPSLLNRYRRSLNFFVGVAALVLCSAQVLADQHLHDTALPEEFCNLCGFSGSAAAPTGLGPAPLVRSWARVEYPGTVAASPVSRPFENSHSRAPPLS